jgi:amidase
MHTAAGAAAMLAWNPDRDAFLVSQLRDAGAVVMGKANLSEWANYVDPCMPNGFSTTGGQTQNPYGPFETYGSSSGSAVSVAADLTTVSVGSETQGSILLPAGINSVVGLKTSMGMVSRDYVIPLLPMQDVPGPMGRSVTDVAVLLSAMTGVDANDFTTSGNPLVGTDFTQFLTPDSLKDLKVGLPVWNEQAFEQFFADFDITDEETQGTFREIYAAEAESLRATGEMLSAAGVTVVEFPRSEIPPNATKIAQRLEYGYKDAINSFLADLGEDAPVASLEEIIAFNNEDAANRAPYGQGHLEAAENTTLTAKEYATMAQEDNGFARNALDIIFDNYDIDVIVHEVGQLYAPAGYPALTIPSGYAEDGTPLSVVFVGQFWSEPQLLTVGYAFEQAAQARIAPDLETTLQSIREID